MKTSEGVQTLPDRNDVLFDDWQPLDEPNMTCDIRTAPVVLVTNAVKQVIVALGFVVFLAGCTEMADDNDIPPDQRELRLGGVADRGPR